VSLREGKEKCINESADKTMEEAGPILARTDCIYRVHYPLSTHYTPGVDFTKRFLTSKKLPVHSVWQKNRHSISSTLCSFKLAKNYAGIRQIYYFPFAKIYSPFAKRCSRKKGLAPNSSAHNLFYKQLLRS